MDKVIARKQFLRLTDLAEQNANERSVESDQAQAAYEMEIGWPWTATAEQIEAWDRMMERLCQ